MSKASSLVARAVAAYSKGQCLEAGQLIDKAYMALGKRMDRRAKATLHRLDEKFEATCVRKHPRKAR